jgi:glutamine cyclotransferase
MRTFHLGFLVAFLALGSLGVAAAVPVATVEVVKSYPHDPDAFTQGLVVFDGELYEGTGRNGQSSLRRVALDSGEVLQRRNLGALYFG